MVKKTGIKSFDDMMEMLEPYLPKPPETRKKKPAIWEIENPFERMFTRISTKWALNTPEASQPDSVQTGPFHALGDICAICGLTRGVPHVNLLAGVRDSAVSGRGCSTAR